MEISAIVDNIVHIVWSWPFIAYVIGASVACTVILRGVQFRQFFHAWKEALFPKKTGTSDDSDMSPLQAFTNVLSLSLGNGSLAGMATAIYAGGPGAAIWAVIASLLLMSIRFAEVYLSAEYGKTASRKSGLGGPMLYLLSVPGGKILSPLYAAMCLFFGLILGNAMQANSIRLSIETTWGLNSYLIAAALVIFVAYIVLGGAARIVKVSDAIVPIKVVVFFVSSFIVLIYHYQTLWHALTLIFASAFYPQAIAGGALGFTVQQAISYGINRSIMATESGLGTAAVLFAFTGSKDSMKGALMGMVGTFISAMVCFIIGLFIVASGVWQSGETSTALTIAAYNTVFGIYGGWIVSFLSISFGIGVLVTFAYITRTVWLSLTGGRWPWVSNVLFCFATGFGALAHVTVMWQFASIVNACLLAINLFGLVWLSPSIARNLYQPN